MARTGVRSSAIIIRDNKILLVHRKKEAEEYWTFPGGGVEEGETPEQAIVREIKEETSLTVIDMKLAFVNQTFEGGNEHPFYYCETKGKIALGGEEKEKNSENNWYQLEWIDINKLEDINLLPENAKQKLLTS